MNDHLKTTNLTKSKLAGRMPRFKWPDQIGTGGRITPECANTGTVTSYSMTIHDIDMIWEDFWNRWSAVEGDAIASQFQALNALGTAKPEL